MKTLPIRGPANEEKGKADMPTQFSEVVRSDLIRRAYSSVRSNARQPYGGKPGAGMRQMGKLRRRRRDYKTPYGMGMSRIPRKTMSRNGARMVWVGAVAPGTVGGRRSHPPKASKIWNEFLNTKERKKAIRSALAASLDKTLVTKRGHRTPAAYPFILDNSFETIKKTQDFELALEKLGLTEELTRSSIKKIRAGIGKMRGRKHKGRCGILIVVGKTCDLNKTARNIPGLDIVNVTNLDAESLAPGGHPGRLTLYTQHALETMKEKKLFL